MFGLTKWREIRKFRQHVDFLVRFFNLDATLPEVWGLKRNAAKCVKHPQGDMFYLQDLNPHKWVEHTAGGIYVCERRVGPRVLALWTLARHHVRFIDEHLTKIVANQNGTALYASEPLRPAVVFEAGTINPDREPGDRYEIACAIIREFTGLELEFKKHVGVTQEIRVVKDEGGTWVCHAVPAAPLPG